MRFGLHIEDLQDIFSRDIPDTMIRNVYWLAHDQLTCGLPSATPFSQDLIG
jgi:hypothetical protein